MKGERIGRDGCRVPLPWQNAPPGFGFTTGTPWLPIPDAWAEQTVDRQRTEDGSAFALYRAALALRGRLTGDLAWQESPPGTLVFARGEVTCVVNVDGGALPLRGEVLLASEPVGDVLPPGAAAWLR
jgi:alpha-glucosidase